MLAVLDNCVQAASMCLHAILLALLIQHFNSGKSDLFDRLSNGALRAALIAEAVLVVSKFVSVVFGILLLSKERTTYSRDDAE